MSKCATCHSRIRIKGWTLAQLKEREDNELKEDDFGLGRVSAQFEHNELGSAEISIRVARLPANEKGQPSYEKALRLDEKDFDPVADEMDILENKDKYPSFSLGFDSSQVKMLTLVTVIHNFSRKHPNQPMLKRLRREPADLCMSGDGLVFEDGDTKNIADLGGDGLDFGTGSEIGREGGCIKVVADVNAETVINQDIAFDLASSIARDVVSEHDEVDVAICSSLEAVTELSDVAFETAHDIYGDDVSYNVVERKTKWEESEAVNTLCEEIDRQFNSNGTLDFTKYDLVFFPIFSNRQYYLVCFSLKTGVADVLDNVVPDKGILDRTKYESDLDLLMDIFGFYLKSKGLHELSEVIINERRTRLLDLSWKTTHNTNDSVVFLMRHIETYLGHPANLMTTGLQRVSLRILQIMRRRYCKTMLLAPFNTARERFSILNALPMEDTEDAACFSNNSSVDRMWTFVASKKSSLSGMLRWVSNALL
ncbi:hypothetical protein SASPL_133254 [Salvia splendens]|uniref:Ubiquitin-like protease family profile domain-containing protein n=1 Tax=Salvia splendens TaxID=180675 RepID=A0A8X8ZHW1_SALSN|nr:hypothetical protein SASPL_133254 [Salvia splendens]